MIRTIRSTWIIIKSDLIGNWVSIDANLFRPYHDRLYGRLLSYSSDGTGEFSGDEEFVIDAKAVGQTSYDDYGPSAVATDGTNFLVVWVSNQGVYSRLISFDDNLIHFFIQS